MRDDMFRRAWLKYIYFSTLPKVTKTKINILADMFQLYYGGRGAVFVFTLTGSEPN